MVFSLKGAEENTNCPILKYKKFPKEEGLAGHVRALGYSAYALYGRQETGSARVQYY